MQKKTLIGGVLIISAIIVLQIIKRRNLIKANTIVETEKLNSNSPYVHLLEILPVYRDSLYTIYVSKINEKNKIIYLANHSLSSRMRESKFFLHIYPQDKNLLDSTLTNIAFDFNSNFTSFQYFKKKYFVAETNLPNFKINKINTGQYGYQGDNAINWQVENIINLKRIQDVLNHNKQKIKVFYGVQE